MARLLQQPQRRQRPRDRADRVHQPLKSKRAPVCARRHISRQQRFLRRRPHPASEPRARSPDHHLISLRRERERGRRQCRYRVSENRERLSRLQSIRKMPSRQLRKTRKPVGNPLNQAEPRWPRPNQRQKRGQHCRRSLITPVAEQTREPDTEHGAIEPGRFRVHFRHSGFDAFLPYSDKLAMNVLGFVAVGAQRVLLFPCESRLYRTSTATSAPSMRCLAIYAKSRPISLFTVATSRPAVGTPPKLSIRFNHSAGPASPAIPTRWSMRPIASPNSQQHYRNSRPFFSESKTRFHGPSTNSAPPAYAGSKNFQYVTCAKT